MKGVFKIQFIRLNLDIFEKSLVFLILIRGFMIENIRFQTFIILLSSFDNLMFTRTHCSSSRMTCPDNKIFFNPESLLVLKLNFQCIKV